MDTRKYREHLHRERSHPDSLPPADSFSHLYWSILPFLGLEVFAEFSYRRLPEGIVFPFGFFLFWALFYTYRQPGVLEANLKSPSRWDFLSIPTVILSATVWFVKVVFVELGSILLREVRGTRPKPKPRVVPQGPRPQAAPESDLPADIRTALGVMGVDAHCRDWEVIHKRYRELAKKFHPDLNPELTSVGNRFMIYDAAYRRLAAVKGRYFTQGPKRQSHG